MLPRLLISRLPPNPACPIRRVEAIQLISIDQDDEKETVAHARRKEVAAEESLGAADGTRGAGSERTQSIFARGEAFTLLSDVVYTLAKLPPS